MIEAGDEQTKKERVIFVLRLDCRGSRNVVSKVRGEAKGKEEVREHRRVLIV